MNIGVHRFFWIGVPGLLGYNTSSRIAVNKRMKTYTEQKDSYQKEGDAGWEKREMRI